MKKSIFQAFIILFAVSMFTSCKRDEVTYNTNLVNQFIYDGLSQYYFWADDMKSKKPSSSDTDPTAYFKRILSSYDRFSWITDDVQGLLAEFDGTPVSFGFNIGFAKSQSSSTEYYGIIEYVFPNTPASKAGIKRLDVIGKIDGQPITINNYEALYGANSVTLSMYKYTNSGMVFDKDITVAPAVINTNPVLCDSIYEVAGRKVGYLFYTDFISNYNDSLYSVFSKFKQAGVTDLILDIRYNHGGAITAATYLASLIAPRAAVENKSVYTILSYNNYLNNLFDTKKWSRSDSLGVYDKKNEKNPLNANLNLSKVYIIATGDSYSASELTTFCLKSYADVVHIGDTTGGKFVASWTIHPFDERLGVPVYDSTSIKKASDKNLLRNWAMQPIVARYSNKNGQDFSNPGYLLPNYTLKEGRGSLLNWTPIGDTSDTFIAQALWLIAGNSGLKPTPSSSMSKVKSINSRMCSLPNKKDWKKSAVILNNLKFTKEQAQQLKTSLQNQ